MTCPAFARSSQRAVRCELDRTQERAGLRAGLSFLRRRVRVGDDPRAGLNTAHPALDARCPDRDTGIERAVEAQVSHGAGVRPALIALELRDALHRADLRCAGDGARREARAERIERIEPLRELS